MNGQNSVNGAGQAFSLEFDQVWFGYGSEPVIEDITFAASQGDFVAILGPNGSGKTTLLKLLLGLEKPTRGNVKLFGTTANNFRQWDRLGYVPQTTEGLHSQFPATVQEVVVQGLYHGFDPLAIFRRKRHDSVERAMETAGVQDLRKRRISSLSVGQQQRTLIARALVRRPDMLVLDEPVAGVDAGGQEQLYAMLRRFNSDLGITIILVSHDIGAVMREAKTVACINRTLVFHGAPHQLSQQELSTLYGLPMDVLVHDVLHEHR